MDEQIILVNVYTYLPYGRPGVPILWGGIQKLSYKLKKYSIIHAIDVNIVPVVVPSYYYRDTTTIVLVMYVFILQLEDKNIFSLRHAGFGPTRTTVMVR